MKNSCEGHCNCESTSPAPATPVETTLTSGVCVSVFTIPKMDCPSEERMIRMSLEGHDEIRSLGFDLPNRQLRVVHEGSAEPLTARLTSLGLGAALHSTVKASPEESPEALSEQGEAATQEAGTLKVLLAINGFMFLVELIASWFAQSAGLLADSLDMFADAAVYGLALYAVGRAAHLKLRAAHAAGWLQVVLALGALSEVVRRFVFGSEPESGLMMGIALLALVANVTCLLLLSRHRESGAHMKASWIFSSNDVLANLGVIVAGALVAWTHSSYPDLVIGTVIGLVVLNGARRILALKA